MLLMGVDRTSDGQSVASTVANDHATVMQRQPGLPRTTELIHLPFIAFDKPDSKGTISCADVLVFARQTIVEG